MNLRSGNNDIKSKKQHQEKNLTSECSPKKVTYFDQEKFLDDLRDLGIRVDARKPE